MHVDVTCVLVPGAARGCAETLPQPMQVAAQACSLGAPPYSPQGMLRACAGGPGQARLAEQLLHPGLALEERAGAGQVGGQVAQQRDRRARDRVVLVLLVAGDVLLVLQDGLRARARQRPAIPCPTLKHIILVLLVAGDVGLIVQDGLRACARQHPAIPYPTLKHIILVLFVADNVCLILHVELRARTGQRAAAAALCSAVFQPCVARHPRDPVAALSLLL